MARATPMWFAVAPKRNEDGSISLISVSPGFTGLDLLVARRDGKPALVLNDSQHVYVFEQIDNARMVAATR